MRRRGRGGGEPIQDEVDLTQFHHEVTYLLYNILTRRLPSSLIFVLLRFSLILLRIPLYSQSRTRSGSGSIGGVEKDLMDFSQLVWRYGVKFLVSIGVL